MAVRCGDTELRGDVWRCKCGGAGYGGTGYEGAGVKALSATGLNIAAPYVNARCGTAVFQGADSGGGVAVGGDRGDGVSGVV